MQSPEQIEIDIAVRELRHRLTEENDIITSVIDPLIEEAVIQSRKSRFDEIGLRKNPDDPKEIYLRLVDKQKRQINKKILKLSTLSPAHFGSKT